MIAKALSRAPGQSIPRLANWSATVSQKTVLSGSFGSFAVDGRFKSPGSAQRFLSMHAAVPTHSTFSGILSFLEQIRRFAREVLPALQANRVARMPLAEEVPAQETSQPQARRSPEFSAPSQSEPVA
jgi:hypothetical protein